jgi:16S rRNA (guanine966-N2)-methyltransferase
MRIEFPPLEAIRPTPDRVRETLFNWLQTKIVDARCLDLFAGSGALGIEALSRGAAHATLVDREVAVVRHLKKALQTFQAANAEVIAADAMAFLGGVPEAYDIVFLDPPFASDVLTKVCQRLDQGWLRTDAYVYMECSARSPLPMLPPGWVVYRSKRAGEVGYHLICVEGEAAEKSK